MPTFSEDQTTAQILKGWFKKKSLLCRKQAAFLLSNYQARVRLLLLLSKGTVLSEAQIHHSKGVNWSQG